MTQTSATGSEGTPATYALRIMATSDVHAHLMPYDYTWDCALDSVGLVRTASLIRAARAEVANSVLFDNGDFLQGGPLGEFAALTSSSRPDAVHPVIAAMNSLGYDATAVGNHEFSHGLDFLRRAAAQATFPILSANAVTDFGPTATADRHLFQPVALIDRVLEGPSGERASLRLGVIGLLPPQVEIWESMHIAGKVFCRDILEAARAWVPWLRQAGADLVVALCHSGPGASEPSPGMENAAIPLAAVDGIDAIIAGHTHLVLPGAGGGFPNGVDPLRGSINGKPTVMAGFWGSHLGIIDLTLAQTPAGWRVAGFSCATRAIAWRDASGKLRATVPNDPTIEGLVTESHRATLAHSRIAVGQTDVPLHSYFARLGDSAALTLIHDAQCDWLARRLAGTLHEGLPLLSAASPFKSGGRGGAQYFTDIPQGPVELKHIADLYTFPNAIRALCITGRTLREWLERSAAQFNRLAPGLVDQPLFDPAAPSYNFDAVVGVSYQIDLSVPSRYDTQGALINPDAARIHALSHDGRPVADLDRFVIATNTFRASGGGAFPGLADSPILLDPPLLVTEVIRDFIARRGRVAPRPAGSWRIAMPTSPTTAWFDTGPGARRFLADESSLDIRALGTTAEGLLRCEIRL